MTSSTPKTAVETVGTQPPSLEIAGLRFGYRSGFTLSIDALTLNPGQQLLLTGGSGTGKSTLLHLIAGLVDPQAGSVRVQGTEIHRLSGALRDLFRGRHIGMIFQNFNLLTGFTAVENVLAALMFSELPQAQHRTRALDALRSLDISRPDALIDELSIGQQQRVAVARAIVGRPALVLADEPTASLDPENAHGAMELIQRSCREINAALLCVSHDPAMAERFEHRQALSSLIKREASPTP